MYNPTKHLVGEEDRGVELQGQDRQRNRKRGTTSPALRTMDTKVIVHIVGAHATFATVSILCSSSSRVSMFSLLLQNVPSVEHKLWLFSSFTFSSVYENLSLSVALFRKGGKGVLHGVHTVAGQALPHDIP